MVVSLLFNFNKKTEIVFIKLRKIRNYLIIKDLCIQKHGFLNIKICDNLYNLCMQWEIIFQTEII